VLAYAALGRTDPARGPEFQLFADTARRDAGLALPPTIDEGVAGVAGAAGEAAGAAPGADLEATLEVRTFGRFSISVDGRALQFQAVRPRARALLRLLALHSGTPVHREVLCDALWPDVDQATGGRSLHVAISSLRGHFVEELGADAGRLISRDGDAYRLAVPDDAVDLRQFERAVADGRAARARGDRAAPEFSLALAIHRGGLLAEDGPADWVVEVRDRCRSQAVEAAQVVAAEALLDGDLDRAVDACRAGLELDRYHDPLWRILIQARDRAGDSGAAVRERREYAAVLADLGVVEPMPSAAPTPVSPS
jgi:DNA-binding SARP family transcriptional activator